MFPLPSNRSLLGELPKSVKLREREIGEAISHAAGKRWIIIRNKNQGIRNNIKRDKNVERQKGIPQNKFQGMTKSDQLQFKEKNYESKIFTQQNKSRRLNEREGLEFRENKGQNRFRIHLRHKNHERNKPIEREDFRAKQSYNVNSNSEIKIQGISRKKSRKENHLAHNEYLIRKENKPVKDTRRGKNTFNNKGSKRNQLLVPKVSDENNRLLRKYKIEEKDIFQLKEGGSPNSCIVFIGKIRCRALIDTGADICILSHKMYKKFKLDTKIKPVSQVLQSAGGQALKTIGITEITFKLGSKKYTHKMYVVKESTRNMILGLDFLQKHDARIYLDLEKIKLNGEYVDLDQDIQIGSVVRLCRDVVLPAQSRITVEGKVNSSVYYTPGQVCEFIQDEKTWMAEEPGLIVANSISTLDHKLKCKVLIVNTTSRKYSLKEGSILGTVTVVDQAKVCSIDEMVKQKAKDFPEEPDFSETVVPEHLRDKLLPLLKRNKQFSLVMTKTMEERAQIQ